jgi:hypothetical protein
MADHRSATIAKGYWLKNGGLVNYARY